MDRFFHSVTLDKDLCVGCTNCIKRCPTQAIRVRGGKAQIMPERCIDCGECVRVCPHHAKKARHDSLDMIKKYEYTVALPARPCMVNSIDLTTLTMCNSIKALGFDDIRGVARA